MQNRSTKTIETTLFLLLFFLISISNTVFGQINFDDVFDNGRVDSSYHVSSSLYTLAPIDILHVRVTGVKDSLPEFRIYDWEGFRLRNAHRMVYRYENDSTWHFFDQGSKSGSVNYYYFRNDNAFAHDTIYIAYWIPFTWQEMQDKITEWQSINSPFAVDISSRGTSQGGRPLYGLTISDTTFGDCFKQDVVITGRQHPLEFIQSHVINGMIEYLIHPGDSIADSLRKYYRFHFYPMLNPDGVSSGTGQTLSMSDQNRSWIPGTGPGGGAWEIDSIRPDIWNRTNGRVAYSIDIHSNPGHQGVYYYWGLKSGSSDTVMKAANLTAQISHYDELEHGSSMLNDTILGDTYGGTAFTAGNWFNQTMNAISYTLEPSSVPPLDKQRLESIGVSIARGFYGILDEPYSPVQVSLSGMNPNCTGDSSGSVMMQIKNGHSPYSWSWSDGSGDTILENLTKGTYWINVTDSFGCVHSDTLQLTEPDSLLVEIQNDLKDMWAIVSGGTPPYHYSWDGPLQSSDDTLKNILSGSYDLTVTDSLGCLSADTQSVIIGSLNDFDNSGIDIYPNPTSAIFYINNPQAIELNIVVRDMMGREVRNFQSSLNSIKVGMNSTDKGIYFVTVRNVDQSLQITRKVVFLR